MMVFPVLHMEAEKSSNRYYYGFNSEKRRMQTSAQLWSFNFLSKLLLAVNCVRFCLNLFFHEVHEGCLPHSISDQACSNKPAQLQRLARILCFL